MGGIGDGRTALVTEAVGDLAQLVLDDAEDLLLVGEEVLVVGDPASELLELVDELLTLESGEATQTHLEDGLGLDVVQAKASSSALLGVLVSCEERMMCTTSSMLSTAMSRPSRMWARFLAFLSSYSVLRVTTSTWCST
jgi:hypothetical protein